MAVGAGDRGTTTLACARVDGIVADIGRYYTVAYTHGIDPNRPADDFTPPPAVGRGGRRGGRGGGGSAGDERETGPSGRGARQRADSGAGSRNASVSESPADALAPGSGGSPAGGDAAGSDSKRRRTPKIMFDNSIEPVKKRSRLGPLGSLGPRAASTQSINLMDNGEDSGGQDLNVGAGTSEQE